MYLYENWDLSSPEPTEQLSINNEGRFNLTEVLKLRSKVTERKNKIREIEITNNSR